ncbi:CDGSH iron-sulfur domain-containing protein [Streptomyces sp. NBC_00322]|uniref:CDGSH iron-sulfur domain-containing protein n=1 Tax=Streptomyces sp. NBC_00322 TaxID=2975712 RepID=UPI002E298CC9|nr:CDGSH iron-sulfur domain-containing protein [Streptomyces sp. NBC_00322]
MLESNANTNAHPDDSRRRDAPKTANASAPRAPRVTPLKDGPLLMEGPVEIVMPDGTVQLSERPTVAFCTCRRSLRFPFCDTSHRRHVRLGGRF